MTVFTRENPIGFTAHYPAKNQMDVGVNDNITATVGAYVRLDPARVRFMVHGVEVVPEIYTVYHGETDHELQITLYSKKRIKYASDKRYTRAGEGGPRYGQVDVFPSMLNYNSRYSIEIVVGWTDTEGLDHESFERFAFSTEEGVFLNDSPPEYFYSPFTQALANYFPDWSKTRYDRNSVTQQILAPFGSELEKIQDFTTYHNKNLFIQTANLNELSALYKVELGKDYEVNEYLAKSGDSYYVQPEILAVSGITKFDLFTQDGNSLTDFKNILPTRIDTERRAIKKRTLIKNMVITAHGEGVDCFLETPCFLYLNIAETDPLVYKTSDGRTKLLEIRITGVDQYNEELIEDIIPFRDRPLSTRHKWSRIEYIELLNAKDQKATVSICILPKAAAIVKDLKETVGVEDYQDTLYWGIRESGSGTVLEERVETGKTLMELLKTSGETEVRQEFHLVDVDRTTPLSLTDFSIDPFSNKLYGVDQEYLYIFDKRDEYPSYLKDIPGDNGETEMAILLEDDFMGLDPNSKEVLFKIVHRVPGTIIVRYRVKITRPDGTSFYIDYNNQTASKNDAIVSPDQNTIMIPERQHSFTADQKGVYKIDLEVLPRGKNFSNHVQHFEIKNKSALVKYKLDRIIPDADIVSISFLQDHTFGILDSNSILHTLLFRKDGVVVDYTEKILYFIEDYKLIEVD